MKPFEIIVGKGENAGNQHSHFLTMFSTLPNTNFNFSFTFTLSSANVFNLNESKILLFGKELTKTLPKGRNGKYKKKNSIRSFTELKKKTVPWFVI